MVKVMTNHVIEKHPDVAEERKKVHQKDPNNWGREIEPKWDTAPRADPANYRSV
jgi:hypothetical protein